MTNLKSVAIGAGVLVALAGAGAGGYLLLHRSAESSSESESSPAASASAKEDDDAPTRETLAEVIPDDVSLFVEVPSVQGLARGTANMKVVDVGLLDLLGALNETGATVGKAFGLSEKEGSALVSSMKSAAIAARFDGEVAYAGAVMVTGDPAVMKKLLESPRFEAKGKVMDRKRYALKASTDAPPTEDMFAKVAMAMATPDDVAIVWLEDARLLLVGTEAFVSNVIAVTTGKGKALSAKADYVAAMATLSAKPKVAIYAPAKALDALARNEKGKEVIDGFFKDPGPVVAGVYTNPAGLLVTLEGGIGGEKVPTLALPKTPKLDLADKLPRDTVGYVAYSTKFDLTGEEAEKKLVELLRKYDEKMADKTSVELTRVRSQLGSGLAELVDAIGDQAVLAAVTSQTQLTSDDLGKLDINDDIAVIALQSVKDEAGLKKLVDTLKVKLRLERAFTVTATADGGYEADPKGDRPFISVRYPKGDFFLGVGPKALVSRAFDDVLAGQNTLGAEKAHGLGRNGVSGSPQLLSWVDVSRFAIKELEFPAELATLANITKKLVLTGDNRLTMTSAVQLVPKGDGYRVRLDLLNSFGVLPGLGMAGLQRYLAASKSAEAKNTLGAIARSASAAFERETAGETVVAHKLCGSATPVPSAVLSNKKYQPNPADGFDFGTGDSANGWKCLKFELTSPHYYQYGYTVGGPYKGPAHGGPDPGPRGFEAWAVGDLDGDGVTSLFTRTGTVDASGNLKLAPEIFIYNEFE